MFDDRVRALGLPWHRLITPALEKYNETKHIATLVSPDLAAEERPALTAALHARFEERRGRVVPRPKLVPGDKVKIRQKPSGFGDYRRNFSKYSREVFTVAGSEERAGQTLYKLVGVPNPSSSVTS